MTVKELMEELNKFKDVDNLEVILSVSDFNSPLSEIVGIANLGPSLEIKKYTIYLYGEN